MNPTHLLRLTGLFTYPVKSCAPIPHGQADLDALGLPWDRRWMLVDPLGEFVTQRTLPRMALIQPRLAAGLLQLSAPGRPDLVVPLQRPHERWRSVLVWRDRVEAWDEGDEASVWFSEFLGAAVRLVRFPDDALRPVNPKYARHPARTAFSDGYPVLLASEGSLTDLNHRLLARGASPVPMARFRPNLVIEGAPAFAEDTWRRIRIGSVELDVVKPCTRCVITTTDPATATVPEPGEPLATLATYRKWDGGGVIFAQNLVHRGPGHLRVGDAVEVLE